MTCHCGTMQPTDSDGEMPILVQDFGFYNFLQVFAPELRGDGFHLIPGTERDGIIDRSVPYRGQHV